MFYSFTHVFIRSVNTYSTPTMCQAPVEVLGMPSIFRPKHTTLCSSPSPDSFVPRALFHGTHPPSAWGSSPSNHLSLTQCIAHLQSTISGGQRSFCKKEPER